MRFFRTCSILLALIWAGLLFAQTDAAKTADPKAADLAFAQATQERGLDGWMSFFADDAYVGTNPSVHGKLELRRFYQRLFSRRDLKFEWAPDHSDVFPSGLMGYTSGRYKMTFTNFEGKTVSQTGSYVTIWQKQPDGSWKVLSDFGSQDRPEPASAKTSETKPATEAKPEHEQPQR